MWSIGLPSFHVLTSTATPPTPVIVPSARVRLTTPVTVAGSPAGSGFGALNSAMKDTGS